MCGKCKKRNTCSSLCAFAEKYTSQDGQVFEQESEDSIMVASKWNETPVSTMKSNAMFDNQDMQNNFLESQFSTEGENPFSSFKPHHKKTAVFIHRFFYGWSFDDIAEKFGFKDKDAARSIYFGQARKLRMGLNLIDDRKKHQANAATAMKNSPVMQQLNNAQKDYLLYTVFQLTIDEIVKLTGRNKDTIRSGIYRVKKNIEIGKFSFEDLAVPGQWEQKTKENSMAGLKGQKVKAS